MITFKEWLDLLPQEVIDNESAEFIIYNYKKETGQLVKDD